MKSKYSLLMIILFMLGSANISHGQNATVQGRVSDSTGTNIPGVNIKVKNTTIGTTTGQNGRYTLNVPSMQDTLIFSYIGYETREIPINDRNTVDVQLSQTTVSSDENLVVIGYGTTKKKNLTSSVSSVDVVKEVQSKTYTTVNQLLQGQVPGLQAGIATKAGGGTNLRVRGTTSLTAGNDPLIVVDGTPFFGNLSDINPEDVKSIDVLKGASAAAAYGADAANGVIEVTTKEGGQTEKPTVTFKTNTQVAVPGKVVKPYGPDQYVRYRAAYLRDQNQNQADQFLPPNGNLKNKKFLNKLGLASNEVQNYLDDKTINWWDQVNRDFALRQQYNVSIAGKPKQLSYYASLNYTDNKEQTVGGKFKIFRARVNLTGHPTDWLEVGLKSNYTWRNQGFLSASRGQLFNVSPLGDKYNDDGSLKIYPHNDNATANPFLYTSQSGRQLFDRIHHLTGQLFAQIDLPYGISFKSTWSNNLGYHFQNRYEPPIQKLGGATANVSRYSSNGYRWFSINKLTWDRDVTKANHFKLTLLYQGEANNHRQTTASNEDFPLTTLGYGLIGAGANPQVSNYDTHSSGTAAMARLQYQYKSRYLATFTFRRDGYSAFGQSHPYGYFPAVSVGWRISDEKFFNADFVNNLKLRLSWGKNGNRSIGTYSALQRFATGKYEYGGQSVTYLYANNLPNNDLKWEETTQYDIGLDFGLLNDRLTGSVDAYYSTTHNLILNRTLPDITGFPSITTNLGQVDNRGFEAQLNSVNMSTNSFQWQSTFNLSLNRNKIVELYGNGKDDLQNQWFLGHSLHRIWNYKITGVYQKADSAAAAVYSKQPGDFKLRDVNSDSSYAPRDDKVFQGYNTPRFRLSLQNTFSYKNFSASFLLNSFLGYDRSNNNLIPSGYTYGRFNQHSYPYWTPENPSTKYARLGTTRNPNFSYYENASFVRLQNLSIGYHFPASVTNRLNAQSLRVFFNAQNVAVLTGANYLGNDPETGSSNTPRLFSIGITLKY